MKGYEIKPEDKGQDFTILKIDEKGIVIAAKPFQTEIWKGAPITISQQKLAIYVWFIIYHILNMVI